MDCVNRMQPLRNAVQAHTITSVRTQVEQPSWAVLPILNSGQFFLR